MQEERFRVLSAFATQLAASIFERTTHIVEKVSALSTPESLVAVLVPTLPIFYCIIIAGECPSPQIEATIE